MTLLTIALGFGLGIVISLLLVSALIVWTLKDFDA